MSDLKENIIDFAKELGFGEVKFAKYQLLKNETDLLKIWLNKGYNADMDWIKNHIDLREDPRKLLENCNSIIVFAHSYNHGIDHLERKDEGKIARYAWGRDYHKVIKKKLKKIEEYIGSKERNSKFRYFVDSGPVAERDWAVKSGIGARGKNSLMLNKKLGSYFFLSTMLTNIEFEPDEEIRDMCGKCTKCISACPTGAIVEPYVIDSKKCISYWTIESKEDEIPSEIAKNMQNWVFGCDICQEVCPWNNHRNLLSTEDDFRPRGGITQLNLEEISKYNDENFKEKFSGQPIMRTKLKGLQRNAKANLLFDYKT